VGHTALRQGCQGRQRRFRHGLIYIAAMLLCCGASARAAEQTCALKLGSIKIVTRINGADSITLEDGTEVKLAGALTPHARDGNAVPGTWPAETGASGTLSTMLLGKSVEIAFGRARTDRYGRHVAHLFVGEGENRIWVQGALLSSGQARVSADPGTSECLPELLAHERVARQSRLGVWQIGIYRPKSAARTALLMYLRSSFQLVAGQVTSVSRTKSGAYLNFGANWREDFTIHIPNTVASTHPDWAASLELLKDRTVEVRGWIERRNGPMITIAHPAEIEVVPERTSLRYRLPHQGAQSRNGTSQEDTPELPGTEQPGKDKAPPANQERPKPLAPGAVDL
jgi:micrococcal nuclease